MNIIPPNARYTGPPSRERQRELETLYFCDSDNTRGLGYGAMFRKIRGRWHYFEPPIYDSSPHAIREKLQTALTNSQNPRVVPGSIL